MLKAAGVFGQHEGRYHTFLELEDGRKADYDTHCTVGVVTSFLPKRNFEEHAFQGREAQTKRIHSLGENGQLQNCKMGGHRLRTPLYSGVRNL